MHPDASFAIAEQRQRELLAAAARSRARRRARTIRGRAGRRPGGRRSQVT